MSESAKRMIHNDLWRGTASSAANRSDIRSTPKDYLEIKPSKIVSDVIWTLLDAVFDGDDEADTLSFQDKMILEDILRYGTLAEIQRRSGSTYYALKERFDQALTRLYKKLPTLEEYCQMRQELSENRALIQKLREDLLDAQAKVVVIGPMLPSLKKENEALKSELELKRSTCIERTRRISTSSLKPSGTRPFLKSRSRPSSSRKRSSSS